MEMEVNVFKLVIKQHANQADCFALDGVQLLQKQRFPNSQVIPWQPPTFMTRYVRLQVYYLICWLWDHLAICCVLSTFEEQGHLHLNPKGNTGSERQHCCMIIWIVMAKNETQQHDAEMNALQTTKIQFWMFIFSHHITVKYK